MEDIITINGITYRQEEPSNGKRAVVVLDRGWIYAGDVTERDGRIELRRAILVAKWTEGWFDGMISNPKSSSVVLRPLQNMVDIPAGSELYRIPVSDDWGL